MYCKSVCGMTTRCHVIICVILIIFSEIFQVKSDASIHYVFARDSRYWSHQKARQLEDNEVMLIYPRVAYRTWCEAKQSGPMLTSNYKRYVFSLELESTVDMAIVELSGYLHSFLNQLKKNCTLSCKYYNNRIEQSQSVVLKPYIAATAKCDYSPLKELTAENITTQFQCKSSHGFPVPRLKCEIKTLVGKHHDVNATGVVKTKQSSVTTFDLLTRREFNGAKITCKVEQLIQFMNQKENFTEGTTLQLNNSTINFKFTKPANSFCALKNFHSNLLITIKCVSFEGYPKSQHSCISLKSGTFVQRNKVISTIGDDQLITEFQFNNTEHLQDSIVTCTAQQGKFHINRFDVQIPKFKNATKLCTFLMNSTYLNVVCMASLDGYPLTDIACLVATHNSSSKLDSYNQDWSETNIRTYFYISISQLIPESSVRCTLSQSTSFQSTFTYRIPKFIESKKRCSLIRYMGDDAISCVYTNGYPQPTTRCIVSDNSTLKLLNATLERINLAEHTFQQLFTITNNMRRNFKTGKIVCVITQSSMFNETFVHFLKPLTESRNTFNNSNNTNSTLQVSFITATVVLLTLLVIMFVLAAVFVSTKFVETIKTNRAINTYRNKSNAADDCDIMEELLHDKHLYQYHRCNMTDFNVQRLVNELYWQRNYGQCEKSMQEIDQQSLNCNSTNVLDFPFHDEFDTNRYNQRAFTL